MTSPISPIDKLVIRIDYGIEKSKKFFLKFHHLTRLNEKDYQFEISVPFSSDRVWSTAGID